jgi:hypothetical protein
MEIMVIIAIMGRLRVTGLRATRKRCRNRKRTSRERLRRKRASSLKLQYLLFQIKTTFWKV